MFKIKINIDSQGFKEKPKNETGLITHRMSQMEPVEVTLEQLRQYIATGHTFISGCVIDTTKKSLQKNNTHNYPLFALDVDNKDNPITPKQLVEQIKTIFNDDSITPAICYDTFSSTNELRKFRLVYVFEKPIESPDDFQKMYKKIITLLPNCVDKQTNNPNRLWYSTNKVNAVLLNRNIKPLGESFFNRLDELVSTDESGEIKRKEGIDYVQCGEVEKDIYKYVWFKNDKDSIWELTKYVRDNIPIEKYVEMMGGDLVDHGDYYHCACPFHGGTNKKGFAVFKKTNSAFCYTKNCIAGDVISLCKVFENKTHLQAIKSLLNRFELEIPVHLADLDKSYKGVY